MRSATLAAAKALLASVEFDDRGIAGKGGNGGLISPETIRAAAELRIALDAEAAAQRQEHEQG